MSDTVDDERSRSPEREDELQRGLSLIVVHAPKSGGGRALHCKPGRDTILGRDEGTAVDLRFDDKAISERHACISITEQTAYISDLGSKNGVYVGGAQVPLQSQTPLVDGAVLLLGKTVAVVRFGEPRPEVPFDHPLFPGRAPSAIAVRTRLERLVSRTDSLLILGENGTGKEYVALGLHRLRGLEEDRFRPINCANLKGEVARAELFGTEEGIYTGAQAKPGLIATADRGTLFLDELATLPEGVQAELLRFLQDGRYGTVGGIALASSSACIIAATNGDLDAMVAANRFRRDLLARLCAHVDPIRLPPMRERPEDVLLWFDRFLAGACERAKRAKPSLTAKAAEALLLHDWPENLRGLQRAASVAAENAKEKIELEDLPERVIAKRQAARAAGAPAMPLPESHPAKPLPLTREVVESVLRETHGNMKLAAERLGVDRTKLYRICRELRIDPDAFRD